MGSRKRPLLVGVCSTAANGRELLSTMLPCGRMTGGWGTFGSADVPVARLVADAECWGRIGLVDAAGANRKASVYVGPTVVCVDPPAAYRGVGHPPQAARLLPAGFDPSKLKFGDTKNNTKKK
jgi:hypothetical protein